LDEMLTYLRRLVGLERAVLGPNGLPADDKGTGVGSTQLGSLYGAHSGFVKL